MAKKALSSKEIKELSTKYQLTPMGIEYYHNQYNSASNPIQSTLNSMYNTFSKYLEFMVNFPTLPIPEKLALIFNLIDYGNDGRLEPSDFCRLYKVIHNRTLKVGDRVKINFDQRVGVIKYLGKVEFEKGDWVGIELSTKEGRNNGTVKDKKYFECKPDHGIFVTLENVELMQDYEECVKIMKSLFGKEEVDKKEFGQMLQGDEWIADKLSLDLVYACFKA